MTTPRFVVAGEALVDIVIPQHGQVELAPGGSPLNVAVGLSRLGIATLLVTQLGEDDHGRLVREHVERSGVVLSGGSVTGEPTSTATARLDERGAATYDFDLHWNLPPLPLPEAATALHVGSIGAALRPGRQSVIGLVEEAAAAGLQVSFDPNVRPAFTPDAAQAWRDVLEVAAASTLVKLSDEDLEFLQPGGTPADVADALLRSGRTEVVVVTHGGAGAVAVSRGGSVEVPSRPVDVVDTVGAGDSFMAALLAVVTEHGLPTDPERLRRYVEAGHQAAAVTVSRRGADPPQRRELPNGWPGVA